MERLTRRTMLGGAGAVALTALAGTTNATARSSPSVDGSHATKEVVRNVTTLFRDKTSRNVDLTMAHFARYPMVYTDAALGWVNPTWEVLEETFQHYMPTWPDTARSYPTRIIGDERSAIVMFTDSPELFGHEIRIVAAVDFRAGKVVRQVDYWDGRHFGIAAIEAMRTPDESFPQVYGEDLVPDQSSSTLRATVASVRQVLATGAIGEVFAADAVFEDLTLHTAVIGPLAIAAFLERAWRLLPYGGVVNVRHTVGSAAGGGYEWVKQGAAVDHGIVAVEVDSDRKITRLTAVWDGSRVDDATMTALLATTIER